MKSGKAEEGTESAKMETAAERRSTGKEECGRKGEAEAEDSESVDDEKWESRSGGRATKREIAAERRSLGKGEKLAK